MVQALRVFAEDDHVDLVVVPYASEFSVDLVRHAFEELDGSDVCVELQPSTQAEDDASAGEVTVLQASAGQANGTEEDGVCLVLDAVKGPLGPLETGFLPHLTTASDLIDVEPVVRVLLDGVEDAHGFDGDLATHPVAGEHCDAVVTHTAAKVDPYMNGTHSRRWPNDGAAPRADPMLHSPSERVPFSMTKEDEGLPSLPAGDVPEAVMRLVDVMAGLDPEWRLEAWLEDMAEQHLDLVEADLVRERLRLEQRLHRLDAVQRRVAPVVDEPLTVQRNLFDCFDPVGDDAFTGLGRRSSSAKETSETPEEPHPARLYIDLLPGEANDDPLLAVAASAMLGVVDEVCQANEGIATLTQIFDGMIGLGVTPDEIDEALDHLLTSELLLEIDDDIFVPCAG